jgi:hypothetical protein
LAELLDTPPREPPRCDFCAGTPPTWELRAQPSVRSDNGRWLACDRCAGLVSADDVAGLVARAHATFRLAPEGRTAKDLAGTFVRVLATRGPLSPWEPGFPA